MEQNNWFDDYISLGRNRLGVPIPATKGTLYLAGMYREDFEALLASLSKEDRAKLIELRRISGEEFTSYNISTTMASELLVRIGEDAYQNGCREEWATYAHGKVKKRKFGCLIVAIPIVLAIMCLLRFSTK